MLNNSDPHPQPFKSVTVLVYGLLLKSLILYILVKFLLAVFPREPASVPLWDVDLTQFLLLLTMPVITPTQKLVRQLRSGYSCSVLKETTWSLFFLDIHLSCLLFSDSDSVDLKLVIEKSMLAAKGTGRACSLLPLSLLILLSSSISFAQTENRN